MLSCTLGLSVGTAFVVLLSLLPLTIVNAVVQRPFSSWLSVLRSRNDCPTVAIALQMYCIFLKSCWNPRQQNRFSYLFNLLNLKKQPCLGLHKKIITVQLQNIFLYFNHI